MQVEQFLKAGSRYRIVALGAASLTVVVLSAVHALLTSSVKPGDALGGTVGFVDVPMALFITLASFLMFSGMWEVKPETKLGEWAVRCVIAILVVLNLLAWGVAVWLR